ncbi:hypothetical protein PTE30175_04551 [Pandoraea terrae]|uniref:Uncharacterized protein n=1 Tax=Pandoraea terrae TaxID=1537710 RepID=A0A5E4YQ46_9BURK|nr:hypothetical protein PTE30175_04551 [Pandoraea terrae]
MTSSELPDVMVDRLIVMLVLKVMVSPASAEAIALRKVPAPESPEFVTVIRDRSCA